MLKDYSHILTLLQRKIASEFDKDRTLLNSPGKSIACKVDPHYYVAVYPGFIKRLSMLGGYLPATVEETLLRTGNLIKNSNNGEFILTLEVKWKQDMSPLKVRSVFVRSSFVDNALRFYSNTRLQLPISHLKISRQLKDRLTSFFEGKTMLHSGAFF